MNIKFLSHLWRNIGTARFRSNFRVVALANLTAQLLLILAAPVLSRLFTPSDLGVLALYISLTSLITSIATFRFDWLIPNSRNDRSAVALFVAGTIVLILFVLIMTVASVVIGDSLLPDPYDGLQGFLLLIPVGILGLGLNQLFQGWYVRRSNLLPVSKTKIVQSFGNIVISIALGLLSFGSSGLLLASVVGSWLGITILTLNAPDLLRNLKLLRWREVIVTVRRYLRQSMLSTMVSVLNVASSQAIILFLMLAYAPAQVGLVAFAQRLMAAPVAFLAQALSQSFWAHAADLASDNNYVSLRRDYLRVSGLLACMAALLALIALAIQPLIVPLFGSEWNDLGVILLALMPLILGSTVVSSTNHLVVLNRQGLQIYADILRLGLVGSTIVMAAIFSWEFKWAVLVVACCSLFGHFVLFLLQLHVHAGLIRSQKSNTRSSRILWF